MADWIKTEPVNERLQALVGKGWDEEDVKPRILRATVTLKTLFTGVYAPSTITGWDVAGACPQSVQVICADYSAMILKEDFFDDYELTTREKSMLKMLESIKKGSFDLLDDDGALIPRQSSRVKISSRNKTKIFTMGNTGDGTWGDGSLDDYGVDIYQQINEVTD